MTWTGPTYIPTSNSEDIQTRRDEAEKRALKRVEDAKEKRRKDKANEERRLIQKQIDVERAARERIEGLKLAEKEAAQVSRELKLHSND